MRFILFIIILLPIWAFSQNDYAFKKYEGLNLFGVSDQGIVEGPDGTIYIYSSTFAGERIYRYDEEGDSLVVRECLNCFNMEDMAVAPDGTLYVAAWTDGLHRLTDTTEERIIFSQKELVALGPDGTIYLLFERGKKKLYESIAVARFNLAWLVEGQDWRKLCPN